jgi:hypothetical protein
MPQVPGAILFIGSGCRHCPIVLEGLARLVKEGRLGRLEVINATVEPELAARNKVRSVPWTRIGPFELIGALTPIELADWTELATTGEGWPAYYVHLIESRRLDELEQHIRDRPSTMVDLLALLNLEDVPMGTRIGISAVIEAFQGTKALSAAVPELEQLTLSDSAQTRGDACHFLGLAGERRAIPSVRRLLEDEQPDVREIAVETLALLGAGEDT